MPHCTMEYSSNILETLDVNKILKEINKRLAETKLFSLNDIKSRIVVHNNFAVGDGDKNRAFVTINFSILSGRDTETKKMLSNLLLKFLDEYFCESRKKLKLSLTVQISELSKEYYGRIKNY